MLWAKQLAEGGLVGGVDLNAVNMDMISYEHGDAYEGKWSNPIIMNGVLFYTQHAAQSAMNYPGTTWNYTGYQVEQRTVAIDLHTGKELWNKVLGNNERQAFGQIFYWKTMNMYGAFSYLWTTVGSTWNAYDPFTGRWEYTITGVPSGYRTVGPNGEILIYTIQNKQGWMTMWNSTETVYKAYLNFYLSRPGVAGQPGGGTADDKSLAEYYAGRWRPHGITFNGTVGIQWNVTIPLGLPVDTAGTAALTSNIQTVVANDRIIGSNTNWAGGAAQPTPVFWAVSIKPQDIVPGQPAKVLFNRTWTLPMVDVHVDIPGSEPASLEDGVFIVSDKEQRTHYGFSLDTGEQLWGPTEPAEPYLSVFTSLYMNPWGAAVIKYGTLYTAGMSGVVNAYNVKTGKHLWTYNNTDPYTEQLFSQNWPTPITFIVDGKIYLCHQEHSANTPVPRGAPTVCLNATDGTVIWRIDGLRLGTRWGGQPIIGDSIIAALSSYDNQVVAIGKGPTATTVTAPDAGVAFGSSVTIKGMVTDISPGTEDAGMKLRFPNGVAAVTDNSMSEWMKYVYMQFPQPKNATGVEVTLSVRDANGNFRKIGKATSDTSGFYSFDWIPDIPGKYTVIANFAGSKSYWPSSAETAFTVEPALTPPAETPQQPPSNTDTYIMYSTIAIVIAIVAGFAVAILLLRKKP
jgi:outer membrane protein assembly factor BamB